MVVSDAGKVFMQALILIGLFLLVMTDKAAVEVILPIITGISGVFVGNGSAAVRKHAPSAMLTAPVHGDEVVTIHGSYPIERETNDS